MNVKYSTPTSELAADCLKVGATQRTGDSIREEFNCKLQGLAKEQQRYLKGIEFCDKFPEAVKFIAENNLYLYI